MSTALDRVRANVRTAANSVGSARVRALLSLGMVLGLGAVGTLGAWSATTTTTSGTFTTAEGTVDIKLNNVDGTVAAPYDIGIAPAPALLPGQTATVTLPVQNRGTLPFSYTTSVASATALGRAMTLTITTGATVVGTTCSGGTAVVSDHAITATNSVVVGSRGLDASTGAESLCLQFKLHSDALTTLQGASGSVQFTFVATG